MCGYGPDMLHGTVAIKVYVLVSPFESIVVLVSVTRVTVPVWECFTPRAIWSDFMFNEVWSAVAQVVSLPIALPATAHPFAAEMTIVIFAVALKRLYVGPWAV